MRRLLATTTALVAAALLASCAAGEAADGAGAGNPSSSTSSDGPGSTTTSGDSGAMQTGTPGAGGTWAGQLGPVDMPPGPYPAVPAALPTSLEGWHASRGATATRATYLPADSTGDAPGISVELHHGGQPNLTGGNDGHVHGQVYCEPGGGSARDRCAVPFEGGYLTLRPGAGTTDDMAVELGNALSALAGG